MSQTSTGAAAATLTSQCTVPAAGDPVTGAGLKTATDAIEAQVNTIAGRAVDRTASGPWVVNLIAGGQSTLWGIVQVELGKTAEMALDIPHGTRIHTISLMVDPALHASLPANPPTMTLAIYDTVAGSVDLTHTVVDAVSPAATYSVAHDLVLTLGPTILIDRSTKAYTIIFAQEYGANSADGNILTPRFQVT